MGIKGMEMGMGWQNNLMMDARKKWLGNWTEKIQGKPCLKRQ